MTTKTLTGTYSAGYSLAASYSSLLLKPTALIEGAGLSAPATATVTNHGSIFAGDGASGMGAGGTGQNGVLFEAAGQMTNSGVIAGGVGGYAGNYFGATGGSGYAGGTGGIGIDFLAAAVASNSGSITGGAGGYGGGVITYGTCGAGGVGGVGVELAAGGTLSNSGFVGGGGGGESGEFYFGLLGEFRGAGGNGGAAVVFGASGSLSNTGKIMGGFSGYSYDAATPADRGGDGVAVANAATVLTVTNAGEIVGGGGGGPELGIGGDGVRMAGGRVVNSGVILGGAGGINIRSGNGGDGVQMGAGTVVNSGTIAGGGGGGVFYGYYGSPALGGAGLILKSAGVVTNTAGLIEGGEGGRGSPPSHYYSTIPVKGARGGYGVELAAGGTLTNHATIAGGQGGMGGYADYAYGGAGGGTGGGGVLSFGRATILNLGSIAGGAGGAGGPAYSGPGVSYPAGSTGQTGNGVNLSGGGTLTNGSTTLTTGVVVDGSVGVFVQGSAAATVINFATIEGSDYSVLFSTSNDVLVAEAGAVFNGAIYGGGGAFELNGGTGVITDLGDGGVVTGDVSASFGYFGSYTIGTGGDWTLISGALDPAAHDPGFPAQTLTVNGTLNVTGALSVATAAGVVVAGTLDLVANPGSPNAGGQISLTGALSGAGTLSVGAGAVASFGPGASLTIGDVTLSSATSQADVNDASLIYAGKWTQNGGTLSVAGGDAVTFTGAGDTFKGTLAGGGLVVLGGGSDTLNNLTIDTVVTITGAGTVTATGAITMDDNFDLESGTLVVGAGTGGATFTGQTLELGDSSAVTGASASSTFTNNSEILGAGQLGDGHMRLVNETGGAIGAESSTAALVINTGTVAIVNDGQMDSYDAGGMIIESKLTNAGLLFADGGDITAQKAVSGAGSVEINSATADFASTFTQNVDFVTAFYLPPASGTLELAKSQTYTGTISGFTTNGATALDLGDIKFAGGTTTATYSGTAASGVLTVADGTHTAHIKFAGDYTASGWTVSSDGHGGTTIVDPAKAAATPPPHTLPFITAMAGFGGGAGPALTISHDAGRLESTLLTRPA